MAKKRRIKKEEKRKPWGWITLILLISVGFLFISCVNFLVGDTSIGNVASIPIEGVILMDGTKTSLGEAVASAKDIVGFIEEADADDSIEAIILDINSPGGSAVASMEIAEAVKKAEKPVIAVIREIGASGAYWIASAADTIYARDLSITGSIGVIASYIEFAGLLERYNMTYRRLVAGERKDIGNPFRELKDYEADLMQQKLDYMHEVFIAHVAANRGLAVEDVRVLADGFIYLGVEAKENGLIDEIGSYADAVAAIEADLNITVEIEEYEKDLSFIEALASLFSQQSYNVGIGIGDSFKASRVNKLQVFA